MISEILTELGGRIPAFKGVILIGSDGFAVDKYIKDADGLEDFVIEFLNIIRKLDSGLLPNAETSTEEITIKAGDYSIIFTKIVDNYLIALGAGACANMGRCKYELKKAALDLKSELATR